MKQVLELSKLELIDWIVRQEKAEQLQPLLDVIRNADIKEQDKSKIVGYRVKGQRITKEMLVMSIQQSLDQIADGEVQALSEIEKDSEQW
jgi:type II secretory pathway component PulC